MHPKIMDLTLQGLSKNPYLISSFPQTLRIWRSPIQTALHTFLSFTLTFSFRSNCLCYIANFFYHRSTVVKEVTIELTKAEIMILISNWKRPYERRQLPIFRVYPVIRLVGDKHHMNFTRYTVPEAGSSQV